MNLTLNPGDITSAGSFTVVRYDDELSQRATMTFDPPPDRDFLVMVIGEVEKDTPVSQEDLDRCLTDIGLSYQSGGVHAKELTELREQAARYRWLMSAAASKAGFTVLQEVACGPCEPEQARLSGKKLDAAIKREMSK